VSLNRWVFKWHLKVRIFFCTVECQQVESSRWMEQQQKKRDGPVRCVCEERRASEHLKSAEPEVVHVSVPARWDTLEWLWSAPCESVQPVYRWPAASPEASVASEAAAWRRCDPGSGKRLWPGCSGALQLIESRRRCATQQCIAVVQPGSNDAAGDCLGDVVSQ